MVFKRFKINCTIRVLLLSATIYLFFFLLFKSTLSLYATIFILGSIIIYQIYALIKYVEKTNRELSRFLQSIKHADFSQSFSSGVLGSSFEELNSGFTEVMNEFRQTRAEKEGHFLYLQTVVQHVGIGLISFQPNGEVELINNAAKRLLKISQLKNLKSLENFSKPLAESMLRLKSGESALIKIESDGELLHLAINATEFKLKEQLFTLVSLQNIQSELERERMAKELEIAQEVQKKLLPKHDIQIQGYDVAGICIPAKEVGGDYYDFISLGSNKFGIVIGDVSGKGVPAAIYMTLTKGIIQAYMEESISPIKVLTKVNNLMYRTIERDSFVSMIFAVLDLNEKKITYARAGHNPAIYYHHASNILTLMEPDGIALGLENGEKFQKVIREKEVKLEINDLLVFYTDGITEAMNENHNEFGEERLLRVIQENQDKSAKNLINCIYSRVQNYIGESKRHDDMTMVVLKVCE